MSFIIAALKSGRVAVRPPIQSIVLDSSPSYSVAVIRIKVLIRLYLTNQFRDVKCREDKSEQRPARNSAIKQCPHSLDKIILFVDLQSAV